MQPKFTAKDYNFVAKRFRETLGPYMRPHDYEIRSPEAQTMLAIRGVVINMAIDFAKKYQEDNERFDPIKFLNACSPVPDLFPLSELWEENE